VDKWHVYCGSDDLSFCQQYQSSILYSSITGLLKEPVVAVALILMLYLETDRNTHPFNGPFPGLPR